MEEHNTHQTASLVGFLLERCVCSECNVLRETEFTVVTKRARDTRK